jgi:hypothetical protein
VEQVLQLQYRIRWLSDDVSAGARRRNGAGSGPILLKGSTGRTDDFCAAVVPVLVG